MKYRKLRIAWSVGWGVLCLLLIALWVRSYWCRDAILHRTLGSNLFVLSSMRGKLVTYGVASSTATPSWELRSGKIISGKYFWADETQYQGVLGFAAKNVLGIQFLSAPHWFFALSTATIAAGSLLLRRRFSLRTLLIGMTVVAMPVAMIAWAAG
jgi:hypothetical protein